MDRDLQREVALLVKVVRRVVVAAVVGVFALMVFLVAASVFNYWFMHS
jgi:hypothetical protein